jgi:hypothetical protein
MFPSPCRGIQGRPLANASSSDSETEGWAEATLNSPSLGLFVHAAWSRWEAERGWSQRVRLSRPRKFGFLPTSFTPKILSLRPRRGDPPPTEPTMGHVRDRGSSKSRAALLLLLLALHEAIPIAEAFMLSTNQGIVGMRPPANHECLRQGLRSHAPRAETRLAPRLRHGRTPLILASATSKNGQQHQQPFHDMDTDSLLDLVPKHLRSKGRVITYSRKVFIPLTRLCR